MVLAVVVGILVFRVYQVLRPATGMDPGRDIPRPPSSTPPPTPPVAANPITQEKPESRAALLARHPFVWQALGNQSDASGADSDAPQLEIRRFGKTPDGRSQAQIKSRASTKWYTVGSKFESYEITDIDVDAKTVKVYSENSQKESVITQK
jgi:hypothetical protein